MDTHNRIYPFSAIVGQERMKKALILNAINPGIGGVLIKGEKGTAKSTAVRALANLLPDRDVMKGCSFNCDPADLNQLCHPCKESGEIHAIQKKMSVIELPVSATEDKVVGTIDIEHAIKKGEKRFEPGILAQAHRNILYIDEVNLLNDHIVDLLLDVAAMGVNHVEREGISFEHPSHFILIGTMNPEEGDLRPQLLDRFGLCVEVEGIPDVETRMNVVVRRSEFDEDPESFQRKYEEDEAVLRSRTEKAKLHLKDVVLSEDMLRLIVSICIDMGVDGHRGDITMMKTARTLAAYYGRDAVSEEDVREAAELVLVHRMKRQPFSQNTLDKDRLEESISKNRPHNNQHEHSPDLKQPSEEKPSASDTTRFQEDPSVQVMKGVLSDPRKNRKEIAEGRGRSRRSISDTGHYVRSVIPRGEISSDIALDATIRVAASHQNLREGACAICIEMTDLREKVRERKIGNTLLFVVDASGSMGVQKRMSAVKGAILSLLKDAYRNRDRVGLLAFKGKDSEILLSPTSSVELAREVMTKIPTGGKTPLSHGLKAGLDLLKRERMKNPETIPLLVLISDGKANVSMYGGNPWEEAEFVASSIKEADIRSLVIDTEQSFVSFGLAQSIADDMGGKYLRLDEITSDTIADSVRGFGM